MARLTTQSAGTLIRVFKRFGFTLCPRKANDHIRMQKPGVSRPLIIQDKRDVPVFAILCNLRTAGISRDEYLHTLENL